MGCMYMAKAEKLPFIVKKGCLEPANGYTVKRLKERGYKIGDSLMAVLTKSRNPGFHRLSHRLGTLVIGNIDCFKGLNEHECLKRLQWESGCGCETIGAMIPNIGMTEIKIPKSLSYENMDQGEFEEVMKGISRYISEVYWPSMTAEQIEEMADAMPEE